MVINVFLIVIIYTSYYVNNVVNSYNAYCYVNLLFIVIMPIDMLILLLSVIGICLMLKIAKCSYYSSSVSIILCSFLNIS